LIYVHDVLNIVHGNLHCDNIYLDEDGEIKIGDGISTVILAIIPLMLCRRYWTEYDAPSKTKDVSRDVEAVYDIAERLLNLDGSADKRSLSW
jgi:hypothetical protein